MSLDLDWFDAHLDLAYLALDGRDMRATPADAGGANLPGCITFPSLREGRVRWALGTIFTEPHAPHHPYGYGGPDDAPGARAAGVRQLELYQAWEKEGLIRLVRTGEELDHHPSPMDQLQVILLMENADPIADAADARWWFDQGVRVVGLSWTHALRYAAGNGVSSDQGGLTQAGKELVPVLDELGMVHDLTHLNDTASRELLSLATGPVVATHSAARTLQAASPLAVPGTQAGTVAQRHISDELLGALRRREGMVGLPMYSRFLRTADQDRPTLGRVVDHFDHLAGQLGSRSRVGLGSDYDGGFSALQTPMGLEGPTCLHHLAEALSERGWLDAEIRGLASGHWLDYFERVLPAG